VSRLGLDQARLGEAHEPKRAWAEPNSTTRYTNEPSRAGSRLGPNYCSYHLSVVNLFTSVQSSRSSDQCVVLVTTHKDLECRDIIFYYMEHIVLQIWANDCNYGCLSTWVYRLASWAGSWAYIEPSRASLPSSRSDRAEPGSARYSTEPGLARLVSSPSCAVNGAQCMRLALRRVDCPLGRSAVHLGNLTGGYIITVYVNKRRSIRNIEDNINNHITLLIHSHYIIMERQK
jgi:hypothetical protein